MPQELRRLSSIAISVASVVCWLFCLLFSLVDTTNHTAAVGIALVFSTLHFWTASLIWRSTRSRLRLVFLLLGFPIAVLTIDNLGRLSYGLGGPLFRLLI